MYSLLQHNEDKVSILAVGNNLEEKEHMIIRDGELATIMQQKEEGEAHKLTEKEQQEMTSTQTGKDLLLVWRVLSLYHFRQYSIPQNLGVASKATTLSIESMFFFVGFLLHLQAVFRVAQKMLLWT